MNTEILAARAKEGDADAFAALIWDHMQSMYKVARSILKNDADVADAIQDAILTAFEHLGRLKKPQAFHSWLVRILVNKCYDLLRRKRQVIPMETLPERPVTSTEFAFEINSTVFSSGSASASESPSAVGASEEAAAGV